MQIEIRIALEIETTFQDALLVRKALHSEKSRERGIELDSIDAMPSRLGGRRYGVREDMRYDGHPEVDPDSDKDFGPDEGKDQTIPGVGPSPSLTWAKLERTLKMRLLRKIIAGGILSHRR